MLDNSIFCIFTRLGRFVVWRTWNVLCVSFFRSHLLIRSLYRVFHFILFILLLIFWFGVIFPAYKLILWRGLSLSPSIFVSIVNSYWKKKNKQKNQHRHTTRGSMYACKTVNCVYLFLSCSFLRYSSLAVSVSSLHLYIFFVPFLSTIYSRSIF